VVVVVVVGAAVVVVAPASVRTRESSDGWRRRNPSSVMEELYFDVETLKYA
jgi:hypothetical protein